MRKLYPTDVSDEEWAFVSKLVVHPVEEVIIVAKAAIITVIEE